MKALRNIRLSLAALFLAASLGALFLGAHPYTLGNMAEKSQIILSAVSVSAGTTLVWLLLTFIFGRVYCSTVCPVGTISDLWIRCRRFFPRLRHRRFRYRHRSRWSVHILWIYILCLLIGVVGIPFLIEPWNMMRNVASTVNPDTVQSTWTAIGFSVLTGMIGGIVAMVLVAVLSLLYGRRFCTDFCPLGTAMGYLSAYSLYHLEIDRDRCTSCGLCEEICRSQCIKTVSRYIDDTRCVRCFDCINKCPAEAIRFQMNRNRPATPMMIRTKKRSGT